MAKYKHKQDIKRSPIRQGRTTKRILIKSQGQLPDDAIHGTVVAAIGKTVLVKPDKVRFINENIVSCFIAGTIITRNEFSSIIAVGDGVHYIKEKVKDKITGLDSGTIIAVDTRKTLVARKTPGKVISENIIAANIDYLLILMSAFDPIYNKRLIDRYLISAEAGGVKPAICINKMDLVEDAEFFYEDLQVYRDLNIPIFYISALDNSGLDEVKSFLKGKATVFSGVSGSGKSTLVNALLGREEQAVAEISERTLKGIHRTTSVKMFEIEDDTRIIDSPGIREFGLIGIKEYDISLYFHDFDPYFPNCRYNVCTHTHEPGCAVIEAVENGEIDEERYHSYINIFESIEKIKY